MNNVNLIGRLARDPELRFVPSTGMAVANMVIAVDKEMSKEKKQEMSAQGKPTADFINVTIFGKSAENCTTYLNKGSLCAVHGRLTTNNYTTQTGEKRYSTQVTAVRVEFLGGSKKTEEAVDMDIQPDSTFYDNLPSDEEEVL
ncbi:single-stranded DNA-binding protein [Sedimentibacter sp. MB31-C6]|uniref:single-stranded DNA-binding protein n=1 Tax=Sedimentibacter sp. MB31-C6 TaxID=3109366 RepID=UPI002DDD0071|nr:single-stranded DNA-binding protein [Sedimentibacter sp. MB36-C1]WSI05110.1 single-stranded DNA-binding protein [Sedimentibacter sp. MB36-C1]